jgi:hypothetical protein
MNPLQILVVLITCCSAASPALAQARLADSSLGKLKIGMRLADIRVPLERPFRRTEYNREGTCFYVSPSSDPNLNLMIEHEVLTRIEVLKPGIKTAAGVSVGDPISKIKEAYGALAVETPNVYDNPRTAAMRRSSAPMLASSPISLRGVQNP